MSSPYDANLLASAPKATKAQVQDGYNADLLAEKTSSTPTSLAIADPEVAQYRVQPVALPQKIPFYRSPKGIIIIGVVVAVIIGAILGGAIGGTRGKKSSNGKTSPTSSSHVTSSAAPNQGVTGVGQGINPVTPTATQSSGS